MKKFIKIGILIIGIFYLFIYPKYKTYQTKKKIKEVLKIQNMKKVCFKINPIKIQYVTYDSNLKNDTGEIISFTCIDKNNHLVKGIIQYHDNSSNKDSYVEISF